MSLNVWVQLYSLYDTKDAMQWQALGGTHEAWAYHCVSPRPELGPKKGEIGPSSTTTILGKFPSSLPDSNEPFCMLNRHRELPLPRLPAAPTATSSAYI